MGLFIDGTKRELSVLGLRAMRFAALTVAAVGTFVGGDDAPHVRISDSEKAYSRR